MRKSGWFGPRRFFQFRNSRLRHGFERVNQNYGVWRDNASAFRLVEEVSSISNPLHLQRKCLSEFCDWNWQSMRLLQQSRVEGLLFEQNAQYWYICAHRCWKDYNNGEDALLCRYRAKSGKCGRWRYSRNSFRDLGVGYGFLTGRERARNHHPECSHLLPLEKQHYQPNWHSRTCGLFYWSRAMFACAGWRYCRVRWRCRSRSPK